MAELLVRNNETYKDTRILFVTSVWDTDTPLATIPKDARIMKLVLVNTLGFLYNMDPEEAQETYKVVRVPELKNAITTRYYISTPEIFSSCHKVYQPAKLDIGDTCYNSKKWL